MNKLTLNWATGPLDFALPWGRLLELQDALGSGPFELVERLTQGRWRAQDIRETIRLGLIGGGMPPHEALALVQRYVEARPLLENLAIAQAIAMSALAAPEGASSPKDPAPAQDPTAPADGSTALGPMPLGQ